MSSNKNQKPATNKIEQTVSSILSRLNLPFKEQVSVDKYTVDFLVDDKYIVECYGDFWHCKPNSKYEKPKMKEQVTNIDNDKIKNEVAKSNGYTLLRFWESDIQENRFEVVKTLIENLS